MPKLSPLWMRASLAVPGKIEVSAAAKICVTGERREANVRAIAATLFPPTSRLTSRWERMWLRNQFLRGLLIAPGFAQWKIHRRLITLPAIELRGE